MKSLIITGLGLLILLLVGCGGAGALECNCGEICVNETGWWRDGGVFNESLRPIQAAVDNASENDVICVKDGWYYENVDVNVDHLTIKSENGSATTTVQAASSSDHVFDITADYVNISGFTVTESSKAGIYINAVNHCNISDNLLTENDHGIYLRCAGDDAARFNVIVNNTVSQNDDNGIRLQGANCDNNTVRNNIVSVNEEGIYIYYADYNNITGNTVLSNTAEGIYLTSGADYNNISCNTILNSYNGIYLVSSNHNIITGNNASWNEGYGIVVLGHIHPTSYNNISDNIANHNDAAGIALDGEDNCTIVNNTANSNNVGISLESSFNNNISCNTILNNINDGFYLYDADDNNITCNWVAFNEKHGFHLISWGWENSTGNNISYNNIIANGAYNTTSGGYEWQFYNDQEEDVSATNNWWGTTDDNKIDASIYDWEDNPEKGNVTYLPKLGGPSSCAEIPEPVTLVMVALGLLSLIGLLYRSGAGGR